MTEMSFKYEMTKEDHMKKFIVMYHANQAATEAMANVTPEQREESMKAWYAWKDTVGDALVDFGAPLFNGTEVHSDGTTSTSTKEVSGYSIIQAEDMTAARALLTTHPHLKNGGCEIELHEMMDM